MERFHAVTVAVEGLDAPRLLPMFIIDTEFHGVRTVNELDAVARAVVDTFGLFTVNVHIRPVPEIRYVPVPRKREVTNNG